MPPWAVRLFIDRKVNPMRSSKNVTPKSVIPAGEVERISMEPMSGQYMLILRRESGREALEELNSDQRCRLFFKLASDRESRRIPLRRGSDVYPTILDEYMAVRELYGIVPEFTTRPLGTVLSVAGRMDGYFMEKVDGIRLSTAIGIGDKQMVSTATDMIEYLARIHTKGMAHGDFTSQNMLLAHSAGSRTKVIDPVGYHNSSVGIGGNLAAHADVQLFMGLVIDDIKDLRSVMRSLMLMNKLGRPGEAQPA